MPAEAVLKNGVVGPVGIRLHFFVIPRGFAVADLDGEASAVVAVIAFRVDSEDQDVSRLDFICLVEGFRSLISGPAAHTDPFLLLTVQEEPHGGAVRAVVLAVGELGVIALDIDGAVLGDDPLVGGVLAVAGLHEVRFQFGLAVVVIPVVLGVVRELLESGAVPIAHTVVPAVSAVPAEAVLKNGVVGPVGIRFHFIIPVVFANDHVEPSGVISVVAVRHDPEAEDIAGLDFEVFEGERDRVVVPVALEGVHLFLHKPLIIVAYDQGDSVRIIGIAVVMSEFNVAALHIQDSVILDYPLIVRVLNSSGVYIVFLHLKTCVSLGDIGGLVVVHLGQEPDVGKRSAFQEPPAVGALFHGTDVAEDSVVVIARCPVQRNDFLDRHGELAGIPCVVLVAGDLEAEDIAALDRLLLKAEVQYIVISVALERRDLLLEEHLVAKADRQGHAVRIIGILIRVAELDVAAEDVDLAVFCNDPPVNRREHCAGMYVVFLHFQAVCLLGDIGRLVIVHVPDRLGVLKRSAFVEIPAVDALFYVFNISEDSVVVASGLQLELGSRLNDY